MKKIVFLLATFLLVAVMISCSGSSDDDSPTITEIPTITLDSTIISNGLTFESIGGEKSINLTTNYEWTLNITSANNATSWCIPSATKGFKGNTTIKFTVAENTNDEDRYVSVTIKAGTASNTFKIYQLKMQKDQINGAIENFEEEQEEW